MYELENKTNEKLIVMRYNIMSRNIIDMLRVKKVIPENNILNDTIFVESYGEILKLMM